jgi:hypothetical protein
MFSLALFVPQEKEIRLPLPGSFAGEAANFGKKGNPR